MNCIVCDKPAEVFYGELCDRLHPEISGTYTLKRCSECGLMFVDPQPSGKELNIHYPETYHVYTRDKSKLSPKKLLIISLVAKEYFGYGRSKGYLKVFLFPFYFKLSHLPSYVKNGKLLDIGCGVGNRLPLFGALGWKIEGLEMDQKAAETAQHMGYKIHISTLEDADLPKDYFDVVYLNNVFEHFRNPVRAIQKISYILKNNGDLVLVIPNADSLACRLFKKHWFALEVPRHLFTYNKENLARLLKQQGFKISSIIYTNTFGSFASSLAYTLKKHVNTFSYFEKPLWILNLFLDPLFDILGIGDWMTIRAVKEA